MLKFLIAGVGHSQYLRGGQKRLDTKVERQCLIYRKKMSLSSTLDNFKLMVTYVLSSYETMETRV